MAVSRLQGLNQYTKIVNPDGTPTDFFIRLLLGTNDILGPLGANKIVAGTGIDLNGGTGLLADGPVQINAMASAILDELGMARGDVLYRGAVGWEVLTPGTSGEFLSTGGAGADPAWAAGGGGGGSSPFYTSLIVPTTASFALVKDGATTASMVDTTRGVELSVTGAGAADKNVLLEVVPSAAPWTLTTFISHQVSWRNFMTLGLYAKDNSTGRIHAFTVGYNSNPAFRELFWNTITSISSGVDIAGLFHYDKLWFQLTDDGTNFIFSISTDGETYFIFLTVSRTAWCATPDRCGIFFGVNQASNPQNSVENIHVMSFDI